jgi:hypothetical protein
MSESEISVTDGSVTSPAPQDASGGLEAIGARTSTPRIDPERLGDLNMYATKHDIRHLEDVIAGVKDVIVGVKDGVGIGLRRLETSLNDKTAALDGRISSLEKLIEAKFDGLAKLIDNNMANLKELRASDMKAFNTANYFCFVLTISVLGMAFAMLWAR